MNEYHDVADKGPDTIVSDASRRWAKSVGPNKDRVDIDRLNWLDQVGIDEREIGDTKICDRSPPPNPHTRRVWMYPMGYVDIDTRTPRAVVLVLMQRRGDDRIADQCKRSPSCYAAQFQAMFWARMRAVPETELMGWGAASVLNLGDELASLGSDLVEDDPDTFRKEYEFVDGSRAVLHAGGVTVYLP